MKKMHILFSTLFLLLCLIPSVGMLFFGESAAGANEVLANRPSVVKTNGQLNINLLEDLTRYTNDRFAFRQEMITAYAKISAAFQTSGTDRVILGEDGWLFYKDTADDYFHLSTMTPRQAFVAARTLKIIQNVSEQHGAAFLFVPVPNKNALYGQYMPASLGTPLDIRDNASLLFEAMDVQEVSYLDLFEVFREQAQATPEFEPLYFHTDSHWNHRGAALAADAILSALDISTDSFFSQTTAKAPTHRGDLADMLYPAAAQTEPDFTYAPGFTFQGDGKPDSIRLLTENSDGEGRLLMFRDSFGNALYPFLAQQFEQATFSRTMPFQFTSAFEGQTPDVVVIEIAQRNIPWLYARIPILPAPTVDIELPEAELHKVQLEVETSEAELPGYVRISASGDIIPDVNSPIYLAANNQLFEAFPTATEGSRLEFVAYLDAQLAQDIQVLFFIDGHVISIPLYAN